MFFLFLCERVIGRSENQKSDEKNTSDSANVRARFFHPAKADIMPVMTVQIAHELQKDSGRCFVASQEKQWRRLEQENRSHHVRFCSSIRTRK